jgi:hypothetical protein
MNVDAGQTPTSIVVVFDADVSYLRTGRKLSKAG